MSDETIQEIVNRRFAEMQAEDCARRDAARQPTAEQQLAATHFRERVRDTALACGVLSKSARFIVREAEQIFELKDGQVVAKGDACQPTNPLQPLTLVSWLADLHEEEGYLFEALGQRS